jgi:plastocyanin domain-containing protein
MMDRTAWMGGIASLSLLLGLSGALAPRPPAELQSPAHNQTHPASQFHQLEQPLWLKASVTLGGLGLIGLELWWFLLSKPEAVAPTRTDKG